MTRFKKMAAAVMAVVTLGTSMIPLSADALYFDENSKFAYDLAVEGTSDDMVKVTFYTTNNPGVSVLGVALKYDQDKLDFVKSTMDFEYSNASIKQTAVSSSNGLVVTETGVMASGETSEVCDYSAPIYFSYYFKVKDTSKENNYDFSSCVINYISKNENISFTKPEPTEENGKYPDETIDHVVNKETYVRRIGDIVPSNLIDMQDVTELIGIVSFLNACTADTAIYTGFLDDMLTANYSYTLKNGKTGTYRDRLKNSLYVNNVPFSEVADCDQNGRIEQKDADLLITYCAQAAASQDPETLINTELSKVVYADITM